MSGKELFAGRAQKKAEREALLRAKFEELRSDRIAKYQVGSRIGALPQP